MFSPHCSFYQVFCNGRGVGVTLIIIRSTCYKLPIKRPRTSHLHTLPTIGRRPEPVSPSFPGLFCNTSRLCTASTHVCFGTRAPEHKRQVSLGRSIYTAVPPACCRLKVHMPTPSRSPCPKPAESAIRLTSSSPLPDTSQEPHGRIQE